MTTHLKRNLLVGSSIWLALWIPVLTATYDPLRLIQQLFLLAPLVVVPLGLNLAAPTTRWTTMLQPFCALSVVIAFWQPTGWGAACFAAAWLVFTGLVGWRALIRLWQCRWQLQLTEITLDMGLLFLPVGGGWLVLSRFGANPLDFPDIIILLTAVHFHFAGFAALIFTGLTGRVLVSTSALVRTIYAGAAVGVISGTPLVAAGITFSPLLELGRRDHYGYQSGSPGWADVGCDPAQSIPAYGPAAADNFGGGHHLRYDLHLPLCLWRI